MVIIEDHTLFAESLELALGIEGYDVQRIDVPEEAAPTGPLLGRVVRLRPRTVLLDLDLGAYGDGIRLIAPMAREGSNVVVVTGTNDRARWGEAVRAGARKVHAKAQPLAQVLATVRRIHRGLPVMGTEERAELLETWTRERADEQHLRDRLDLLTAREGEVLGHLMRGRPVREIAALGVVSEATVRTQVKSILAKLDVSSQLAAVGIAHRIGWQPPVD